VFFLISYLVSCMARYLFMSLCGVFDLSYPKMSHISDVGVISYFACSVYRLHLQWKVLLMPESESSFISALLIICSQWLMYYQY
jgi:hypothetical protein